MPSLPRPLEPGLNTPVAVVHEVVDRRPGIERLFQRVQREICPQRARHSPADDLPRVDVDHEGDEDEAIPGRDVGQVCDPELVGPRRREVALHEIRWTHRRVVADRRLELPAANHALEAHPLHQPLHRAPRHTGALATQLPPHLPRTVDLVILVPDPANAVAQCRITLCTRWKPSRIGCPGLHLVVRRRGDRQHPADRLDPVQRPVFVDERHHHFGRRSSSAWAKKADAFRRISLARRSSRFSRSSSFSRSRSLVVSPGRVP